MTARSRGLVVHREIFEKGGEKRRVRVGDAVFAGQPVLDLPDLSEMLVETRVKEGEIHRVEPGQKAEVRLEAFPDETFAATVLRLGALTAGDKGEARTFPLVLRLAKAEPRLRPGMSAQALVLAGEVKDAVQVPVDAVRYEGDQAVCTVRTVTGTETRRVKTGPQQRLLRRDPRRPLRRRRRPHLALAGRRARRGQVPNGVLFQQYTIPDLTPSLGSTASSAPPSRSRRGSPGATPSASGRRRRGGRRR